MHTHRCCLTGVVGCFSTTQSTRNGTACAGYSQVLLFASWVWRVKRICHWCLLSLAPVSFFSGQFFFSHTNSIPTYISVSKKYSCSLAQLPPSFALSPLCSLGRRFAPRSYMYIVDRSLHISKQSPLPCYVHVCGRRMLRQINKSMHIVTLCPEHRGRKVWTRCTTTGAKTATNRNDK